MSLDSFFFWFYYGLGGLGGWVIFFLPALIAVIWILYDSASRRISAPGWKIGVILTALLLVPAILFRFGVANGLLPYSQVIFYLDLLGGILPVVLDIGYYVEFQGMVGCPYGHVYEAVIGSCPYDEVPVEEGEGPVYREESHTSDTKLEGIGLPPPAPKAPAWLVTSGRDKRQYQLNKGVTLIGRSPRSDIVLSNDDTMSREHAKIIEEKGVFRLVDLGSANHTFVNDERVREAIVLEPDDKIRFGRKTIVEFVTSHR